MVKKKKGNTYGVMIFLGKGRMLKDMGPLPLQKVHLLAFVRLLKNTQTDLRVQ